MKRISEFFSNNSLKIVEWMHPPKTRLEKLNSVLISQLFLVAAAMLIYRANILQRIASWTLICIFAGMVLIFSILLLMNVDQNHKWILRAWPYVSIIFQLTIVTVINVQDRNEEIPTVISFLLFPAICETASIRASVALMTYSVIMLIINKFDEPHFFCILVSVVNIFTTICLRLIVTYQKIAGKDIIKRTKTIGKNPKLEAKILGRDSSDIKDKNLATVQPAPATKIKRVVPIYGNNSKASEDDDAHSKML
jgi:hypothetical protein